MKSKGSQYQCSMCNHCFSRKWNAFRHNKQIHSDLADISNNKTKSRGAFNKAPNNYSNKKKFEKFKTAIAYDDFFSSPMDPTEIKLAKIIGQLIVPFEEIEKLVGRFGENEKASILSNAFRSSLRSFNPVKSLNEIVDLYRSLDGRRKISDYVSKSTGMSFKQAVILIDEEIKGASIFKRQNN